MNRLTTALLALATLLLSWNAALAQTKLTIANKTKNMDAYEGFFTFYWDAEKGKVWLEIDKFDEEFLYISSLPAGVGSNDIGLDRGQLGQQAVLQFERSGPRILLVEPNYGYRAITDNALEKRAVEQAFARSVHWGFEVEAEEDGKVLVDATKFFLRDAHGVANRLQRSQQGSYKLDASRSAFYLPMTKNFPENTEIEATITLTGDPKGGYIRSVTPTASAVTVRMHHSFVKLPDEGYEMREYDARSGYYGIEYMDYATPISEPITKRFIARHRLEKKNPNAEKSEPVEPIIYYLDPGTPEPIRSALLEGASWWNQAFEAIGYIDAFQVKMLPEGADPMDVRYNLIQWVHRSTRGWSYGSSVRDPRTGEIIKGHVTLGSLRVRQDFLIAQGLVAAYEKGKDISEEMLEMALARLRQLSAHEVGHTIGLRHNFAASPKDRASVMDYPHPYIKLGRGKKLDLSEAYDTGIGEWDIVTIAYGYQDFPEGTDEAAALNKIIADYIDEGFTYITDYDARATGGAHPTAHLWDNGADPAEELNRLMKVRKRALDNFSEEKIRPNAPMATLEEVLVPMYMMHRYQLEAASKMLGGLHYNYAARGDGQLITKMLPASDQQKALDALLATLTPEALTIPEDVLEMLPPRPPGYARSRETFKVRTGVTFDPVSAAESAAATTLRFILHPERAARLVEYHARDSKLPSLQSVIDETLDQTLKQTPKKRLEGEIQRMTGKLAVAQLMQLAHDQDAAKQVRAIAQHNLEQTLDWLEGQQASVSNPDQQAHISYLHTEIDRFLDDPEEVIFTPAITPPDGSPIGSPGMEWGCGGVE